MKKISAKFEDAELADIAAYKVKRLCMTKDIEVTATNLHDHSDYQVIYPIKPEYLGVPGEAYIDGMPHILSGEPVFDSYNELQEDKSAILSLSISDDSASAAVSTILSHGGYDLKVEN